MFKFENISKVQEMPLCWAPCFRVNPHGPPFRERLRGDYPESKFSLLESSPNTWDPGILFPNVVFSGSVWTTSLDVSYYKLQIYKVLSLCTVIGCYRFRADPPLVTQGPGHEYRGRGPCPMCLNTVSSQLWLHPTLWGSCAHRSVDTPAGTPKLCPHLHR